jgi:hypothetical protein
MRMTDEVPQVTAREALQRVVAIDEKIDTVTRALNPRVRGVLVEPDMDHEAVERMIDLKIELQEQRKEAAALVHLLCELERRNPGRERKIQRDRRQNASNLASALSMLKIHDDLRCWDGRV